MNIMSSIDVTYLPVLDLLDEFKVMDQINLKELEDSYYYALETYGRSFCTYPFLLKSIPGPYGAPMRLSAVIDFPFGKATSSLKVFEAGQAYEICKKGNGGEVDVVLNPDLTEARLNIQRYTDAGINLKIGVKYIIELGYLGDGEDEWFRVEGILSKLSKENCKFVKTNTGRGVVMTFKEKLEMCKKLRELTDLPIKVSGGIKEPVEVEKYLKVLGDDTIFGVSYKTLKEW